MKDKTKGLLLGLALGTFLSGSVAYAGSSQIEVAFSELKYMFDGVEKKPTETPGFIYNGTTYVPLRFVSEALGSKVEWDEANSTVWVGDKTAAEVVVAAYTGGTLTKGDFTTYLSIQKFLNPNYTQYDSDDKYKTFMVQQLVKERWFAAQATDGQKSDAAAKAKAQLSLWQQNFGGEEKLRNTLAAVKLVQSDLEQFAYRNILVNSGLLARVTEEQLRTTYDTKLKADPGAYTIASVRHILIGLNDTATGQPLRSKDEALKRAGEVLAKLKAGGDFAALAKEYSDDQGSKDKGGLYADVPISDWVAEFKTAAQTLPLNQLSDPVLTQFGYHVIKVESRKSQSFDDVKEQLRQGTVQEALKQFTDKELPSLIQSIELPK